jgi:hypothetical protein
VAPATKNRVIAATSLVRPYERNRLSTTATFRPN